MVLYAGGGGGGGGSAYRDQWKVFYDLGNSTYFLRHYVVGAGNSVLSFTDVELDGVTPYTPGPNIQVSQDVEISWLELTDDDTPFLRAIISDQSGVLSTLDYELDATTPYVVSGSVTGFPSFSSELVQRFDSVGGILTPFWRLNQYKNGTLVSSSPVTASGAPYTVVGSEVNLSPQYELAGTYYLDVDDVTDYTLSDVVTAIGNPPIGSIPSNSIAAYIDVEITSLDGDGLPTGNIFAVNDINSEPGNPLYPGYKLYHRNRVIVGESAEKVGDPGELQHFKVRAQAGVTARLVVSFYRRR